MGFVPPTLTVQVPDNCEPGQTIQIQSPAGVPIHVACPMDCGPGSTFLVVNPDAQGSAQLVVPANTLPLPAGASWDGMAPGALAGTGTLGTQGMRADRWGALRTTPVGGTLGMMGGTMGTRTMGTMGTLGASQTYGMY